MKRNVTIDIFRVFFACVVVSIHACPNQSGVVYAIQCMAVPFFAITSGYFSGGYNFKKECKYIFRLCMLAILIDLLNQAGWLLICYKNSMSFFRDVSFYSKWIEPLLLSQAWYLSALIITTIFKRLLNKFRIIIAACSLLVHCVFYFMYYIYDTNFVDLLTTNNYDHLLYKTIFTFMPYYFMGLLIYEFKDKMPSIRNNNIIVIIMMIYILERAIVQRYFMTPLYVQLIVLAPFFIWMLNKPVCISENINVDKICSIVADTIFVFHPFVIFVYKNAFKITESGDLFLASTIISAFLGILLYCIKFNMKNRSVQQIL